MHNPFNPLDWVHAAQNWFSKTEKSSGFRSFLIFLLIFFGFTIIVLGFFGNVESMVNCVVYLVYISVGSFLLLFVVE